MRPASRLAAGLGAGLAAVLAPFAAAQDLSVLAGASRTDEPVARTYGWQVTYAHDLEPWLFATLSYKNEGHIPGHHRDGHSAQLWYRTPLRSPRATLAAGVGPFRFFDTEVAELGGTHSDTHGWGWVTSVALVWGEPSSRWFYQLRLDRVTTRDSLDTTSLLAGVGYRLEQDGASLQRESQASGAAPHDDEIALLLGQTIVNSFESETSNLARSIEYRHAFGTYLRGSLAWIDEGDARLIRRSGILAQLWLEPSFAHDRFTLGAGLGSYLAVDAYRPDGHGRFNSGVVTLTASYHLDRRWSARFSWNRIVSHYDRDTDIILLGAAYRF
jgi:hypothetical protein